MPATVTVSEPESAPVPVTVIESEPGKVFTVSVLASGPVPASIVQGILVAEATLVIVTVPVAEPAPIYIGSYSDPPYSLHICFKTCSSSSHMAGS